jgi:hypothetical protein
MFSLFKRSIETGEVVNDIVELHLVSLLNAIDEMLGIANGTTRRTKESLAFVYTIGVFGIQTSRLSKHEGHKFCMCLTCILARRLGDEGRYAVETTLLLQERLKEYRRIDEPIKWVQAYMRHINIDDPAHVAFLVAISATMMQRVSGISRFINDVRKSYKFA